MAGILINKRNLEAHTHTGRIPCGDERRDQSDTSTSQECQRLLTTTRNRGEAWNKVFFRALRRNQSCQHLDLKTSGPQNYDTKHFYCLSTQLQYLIMATLGNFYNIQVHISKLIYTGFNLKIAWYLYFKM